MSKKKLIIIVFYFLGLATTKASSLEVNNDQILQRLQNLEKYLQNLNFQVHTANSEINRIRQTLELRRKNEALYFCTLQKIHNGFGTSEKKASEQALLSCKSSPNDFIDCRQQMKCKKVSDTFVH